MLEGGGMSYVSDLGKWEMSGEMSGETSRGMSVSHNINVPATNAKLRSFRRSPPIITVC